MASRRRNMFGKNSKQEMRERGDAACVISIDDLSKYANPIHVPNKTRYNKRHASMTRFAMFGIPTKIAADNGMEFHSEVLRDYLRINGVELHFKIDAHHQSNGPTERFHNKRGGHLRQLMEGRGLEAVQQSQRKTRQFSLIDHKKDQFVLSP
ncbi:hypothetical protein AAG570_000021 [Ranatra chinensis]|uniref:Integrase catalytic domain-containing protein n=1 Tax=Ranatra chinensis TaxID=642074 RepID=A0ABD0YY10_9HEMI